MPAPRRTYLDAAFYRRLRLLAGGTPLSELAAATRTNHETCRRYRLRLSRPSAEWLARLCVARGVSLDWLVLGKGRGPKGA